MYKKIIVQIFFVFFVLQSFAISDHTLYFMRDLPLVNTLNPAFQPKRGTVYVGFPAITSTHFSMELSPNINLFKEPVFIDKEVRNLKQHENIGFAFGARLIDVGIMIKDNMYFTLGIETKAIGSVSVNGDIPKLAILGNGYFADKNIPANFDNTFGNVSAYHEISLGFSKQILPDELTVGGNLKYLLGVANAWVGLDNGTNLYTNPNNFGLQFSANPKANIAMPLGLKSQSNIEFQSILDLFDTDNLLDINNLIQPQGHGLAVDLGASWSVRQTNKKLNISLSILDLGFIHWTNNYNVQTSSGKPVGVDFTGVDINDPSDVFNSLLDSLTNVKVDGVYKKQTTRLAGRGYLGVNYSIWKYLNAGFLFGLNSYNGVRYDPSYTFSINTQNFMVNLAASYTIKNGRYDDLGIGVVFGRKYLQVHLLFDNVIRLAKTTSKLMSSSNFQVADAAFDLRSFNFRFGVNFLFGNNGTEKKIKQQKREMREAEAIEKLKQKASQSTTPVTPVSTQSAT